MSSLLEVFGVLGLLRLQFGNKIDQSHCIIFKKQNFSHYDSGGSSQAWKMWRTLSLKKYFFIKNITFEQSKRSQFQRKAQNQPVFYPIVLHQQTLIHCDHEARYQLKDQQNLDLEDQKIVENYSSSPEFSINCNYNRNNRINDIDD